MNTVYLNGYFMPESEARISPLDRGFRFGDGIFETIPFYAGKPYQWDFHEKRLAGGLTAMHIAPPKLDWRSIADELIAANGLSDGFIRMSISRGVGSRGYRPLPEATPTIFVQAINRSAAPQSASLWLSEWRKPPPQSLPAHKIAAQGVSSTLALLEAEAQGCDEALLLDVNSQLCEAASGNLFWLESDQLFTPALATDCLDGATRSAIMRLHGATEITAPLKALQSADAVFLTNCNRGILPVSELKPQGWSWPPLHPLTAQLQAAYKADIDASV